MTAPGPAQSRHHGGPADRYGTARPWVRPLVVVGVSLLAVTGAGWLLWAAAYHSDPDAAGRLESFDVISANQVQVTIRIDREPGAGVTCLLQAQASDHAVVGEREVVLPAGDDALLTRTFGVETERLATAATLEHCRTSEPAAE